jgi:hypothetical protein
MTHQDESIGSRVSELGTLTQYIPKVMKYDSCHIIAALNGSWKIRQRSCYKQFLSQWSNTRVIRTGYTLTGILMRGKYGYVGSI